MQNDRTVVQTAGYDQERAETRTKIVLHGKETTGHSNERLRLCVDQPKSTYKYLTSHRANLLHTF